MARVSDLQSTVARALDLQSTGCGFESRPRRCQATITHYPMTLGKLFMFTHTHIYHCYKAV